MAQVKILGSLQIMGRAMAAFIEFCGNADLAFRNDPAFDREKLHRSFGSPNYLLRCEIDGASKKNDQGQAQPLHP